MIFKQYCVNARYFDNAGSLHFVFYNGGFQEGNLDAQFPTGLNQGNLPATLEVMQDAARMMNYNLDSLLFRWLHATDDFNNVDYRDPFIQGDFTPGQTSRSVARLSDLANMDVDM